MSHLTRLKKDIKDYEGLGQIKFANGDNYRGFTKHAKFEGKGRLDYADKTIYHGLWKDGLYHGKGCFANPNDGTLYHGEYVQGK